MENQTMFLFFLVVSYWGWRKWLKTKSERLLYALCAVTLVGLMNYPL